MHILFCTYLLWYQFKSMSKDSDIILGLYFVVEFLFNTTRQLYQLRTPAITKTSLPRLNGNVPIRMQLIVNYYD